MVLILVNASYYFGNNLISVVQAMCVSQSAVAWVKLVLRPGGCMVELNELVREQEL